MEKNPLDYIIVGQGLAGSCVALQLIRRNKRFMVIDEPAKNRCSAVAAGLFNPVTGDKLVKTWMADSLFPYLTDFYQEAERLCGRRFFHPMPMYRPFAAVEEQNEWMSRSADESYKTVIGEVYTTPQLDPIKDSLGGLMLKGCGYIETRVFMEGVRNLLMRNKSFRESAFDSGKLEVGNGTVRYEDMAASAVIFCEGTAIERNPYFSNLRIRPLKGETITIKSAFRKHVIVNRGVYMVPGNSEGEWKVGSTYNPRDTNAGCTPEGRSELDRKLEALVNFPYEITSQDWGIRPTTADRRPILGKHPEKDQIAVFNGLGTKGVSLAPYFSDVLIQCMENPALALNKDVNVTRFKSLY